MLSKASPWHEMSFSNPEVMGSNPGWIDFEDV